MNSISYFVFASATFYDFFHQCDYKTKLRVIFFFIILTSIYFNKLIFKYVLIHNFRQYIFFLSWFYIST